jgi:SAM-dependent methyltransferase
MTRSSDPLTLFNFTRERLKVVVSDRLPENVDPAAFCAETAYWICLAVTTHGEDWEAAFHEYTDAAMLEQSGVEAESEQHELDLLRAELRQARGPVLDVGAGWGRMASLYAQAGLPAYFVEPMMLGTRLMQRNGLSRVIAARGEMLPFPGGVFHTIVIGWVLHHDAGDVNASHLLRETARMSAPGGLLLSVEPLDERFDRTKWTTLVTQAGFDVRRIKVFYDYTRANGDISNHALLVGTHARSSALDRDDW